MRCLRKHGLADNLSYLPNDADEAAALEFGERLHHSSALYWQSGDPAEGATYLRSLKWPLNEKHHSGLAMSLWGSYAATARLMPFGTAGQKWEAIAIEKRVILDVAPGLKLSYQLDRLLREQDSDRLALVDLKTAARCDMRWADQWKRDLQMKLYSAAVAKEYGRPLDWLIVEGLAKDKATVNYVVVPEFSEDMRSEAWRAFEWVANHDRELLDSVTHDGVVDGEKLAFQLLTQSPFSPAECFAYGHPCDYLRLCDAEPSERVALFKEGYHYEEPKYV